MKSAIRGILYLVIIVGIGSWTWKNFFQVSQKSKEPPPANQIIGEADHIIVITYFTSNVRCKTCLKIEQLTHDTIDDKFSAVLSEKKIIFRTLNYDLPENQHFMDTYGLAFKTVVVSEYKKGKELKWERLDKVWDYVDSPGQFCSYLEKGIQPYLIKPNK